MTAPLLIALMTSVEPKASILYVAIIPTHHHNFIQNHLCNYICHIQHFASPNDIVAQQQQGIASLKTSGVFMNEHI